MKEVGKVHLDCLLAGEDEEGNVQQESRIYGGHSGGRNRRKTTTFLLTAVKNRIELSVDQCPYIPFLFCGNTWVGWK